MIIKECKIHGLTAFSERENGTRYRCRKCSTDAVNKRRRKIKLMAIDYKGGSCIKCGYKKYAGALDFHHRNPDEKRFSIGGNGHCRSWEEVKKELEKCDLVCANCHAEIHAVNR